MYMSFWTAVVIIVALGVASEMYRARLKASSQESEKHTKALEERMAQIEKRMANLETIVLKRENEEKWDALRD